MGMGLRPATDESQLIPPAHGTQRSRNPASPQLLLLRLTVLKAQSSYSSSSSSYSPPSCSRPASAAPACLEAIFSDTAFFSWRRDLQKGGSARNTAVLAWEEVVQQRWAAAAAVGCSSSSVADAHIAPRAVNKL